MHRFLIEPGLLTGDTARLGSEEAQHALKVLRLKTGCPVQAMDGMGRAWTGTLVEDRDGAGIRLESEIPSNESPVKITLYMGIPKGEKLELIAQKLTELGASRLVPVRMERCVARIPEGEAEKKLSRARRISREAQKQSGRQTEMTIDDPLDFGQMLLSLSRHEAVFLLWENAEGYRLIDARSEKENLSDIAFVVGPEGGITNAEAEKLMSAGAAAVTLGARILRAETAAIAGCAAIQTLWGDL